MYEIQVVIAGHQYGIRFDDGCNVHETMCVSRWPWCSSPTGDEWLDGKLASAARQWLVTDDKNRAIADRLA